jgi:hypothetical protein
MKHEDHWYGPRCALRQVEVELHILIASTHIGPANMTGLQGGVDRAGRAGVTRRAILARPTRQRRQRQSASC